MRHILVPTDFSASADNAVAYARLLASEFSARIALAHVHPIPQDPLRIGEWKKESYEEQEAILEQHAGWLRSTGLDVDVILQFGNAVSRLKRIVHREAIDLIVMGCQGEHYLSAKFFGSTTTALMDEVNTPILAVPVGFAPSFPRNPMWATDRRPVRSTKTLEPLYQLVDRATTELRVFHYQEAGENALPDDRFKELLAEVRHDYFVQLADGDTVEGAIRKFVRMTGVDLITVLHRQSSWLSRLITGSYTRSIVWRTPVPVLILQEVHSFSSVSK
ncbi:universal stress protein [Neolewinella litorea]|uniref:UspA domain-containing protein n=1 Tax=Neolewinella litorea TaxID=2562452 RepID=A0A4S4NMW1_9BACT|nr:universal stress protein [Neolewinella litorea]THH40297.1 hypothetical protein E4021_06050 [Neolewinella litorea]